MTGYFTNNSRPYAEQFNDGILLADAFDLTIYSTLPSMYPDGSFNSNLNVDRLAGVSLVTMITNNNVTVTSTNLSGTGTITFRVYPNFALFEKWSKISWEADGDVSCSLAKVDGTPISVSVANGSALASNVELSKLQQIDVTFTLADATITSLTFEYSANSRDRVVASVSKSNVAGLESDLSGIRDDLSSLESGKANVSHLHTTVDVASGDALPNIGTNAGATQRMINEAVDEKVGSLSTSITNTYHWNYQNSQVTGQVTYDRDGVVVNAYRRGNTVTVRVRVDIKYIKMGTDNATLSLATLPSGYRPPIQLYSLNAIYPYFTMFRYGSVNTDGQINLNVNGATSAQTVNAWIDLAFTYVTLDDAPSQ